MRTLLFIMCIVMVAGCSYEGKRVSDYLENPKYFIKDPHFESYQDKKKALESQYLNKEITYAEYIEQKDKLDETYSREVQERTDKVVSPSY